MRWIPAIHISSSLLTSMLNSFLPPKEFGHGRVSIGFLTSGLALLVVPTVRSCYKDGFSHRVCGYR